MRLVEESATVRESFPAEYVDLAVFVTDLGGTTTLMFLLAVCFWLYRRRESALVIAVAFAGFAALLTIKAAIGAPRPPESVHLVPVAADEYGFPSGHAFAAVVAYGGLYAAYEPARERLALLGVAALVSLVSLSRVVLGFHYLGDVLVGAALGVGFLLALVRLCDGDPHRGFVIALCLAIPALFVVGITGDSLLALGGSAGGVLGTRELESLPRLRSRLEGAVLVVAGTGFVGAVMVLESSVASLPVLETPAIVGCYGALVFGIVRLPSIVGRVDASALERPARS